VVSQPDVEGPSPRAVALARFWLIVLGCIWLVLGVAVGMTMRSESWWLWLIVIAVAALHFIAARYARNRVAVFFALFGP
jgi:hypothetical protein